MICGRMIPCFDAGWPDIAHYVLPESYRESATRISNQSVTLWPISRIANYSMLILPDRVNFTSGIIFTFI
jgi:hypothetical protein